MTRAVVIGHSHSAAIAQALLLERPEFEGVFVYRLEDRKRPYERDVITLRKAIWIARRLPADAGLFLSTLGTYHNILGLLRSEQAYDFLLDPGDAPDPDARVQIPHRVVASAFETHIAKPTLVRKMQESAKSRIFLLSSPPPKQSNDFMLERFMSQKKKSYRGKSVEEIGLERPATRLKLWLMEVRAMAKWAESENLEFVPPPSSAFDEDGFLHPRFYSDATHANAQYGALVIEQICSIVERMRKDRTNG
jgi:hypothetical protein